jgi:hypothetical protein
LGTGQKDARGVGLVDAQSPRGRFGHQTRHEHRADDDASKAPWSLYSVLLMAIFVQVVSGT